MRAGPPSFPCSAALAAGAAMGAGCAHYQLGTQGRLAFTTLYVEPVAKIAP